MEYNSLEDSDLLGAMPIDYSRRELRDFCGLDGYLQEGNGASAAGLRHSSSFGAVRPLGHNSNSSLVRFDGGAHCYGEVGLVEGEVADGVLVSSFCLGLEDYVHDEPFLNDSDDLFPTDNESGLSEGQGSVSSFPVE